MPDWVFDIFKSGVIAIVAATVTSIVTVWVALKRFRQEKWWERKVATYAELLESLHHLKKYYSEHLDSYHDQRENEEKDQELSAIWKDSSMKLSRLEDLASFHLSARAVDILSTYRKERAAARSDNTYEWIDGDLAATNACLEALKQEAKRDLKIK